MAIRGHALRFHAVAHANHALTDRILERCQTLGFALAGVCDAAPTEYERELLEWLAAGKHGEMDYLARNVEMRVDPRVMVAGARSIIVVADRYSSEPRIRRRPLPAGSAAGRIARYAHGADYHVVMKKRLHALCDELAGDFPSETFRACVDTAPVLEREHAQRAGLGAIGKNTLLLQRGVGSYLLLGEIITSLELPASRALEPDPCASCTRCIDACPTQAITPWSVDATRCISYLTIEHRGMIDERFHQAMGDWIFGCDICQEVCPHNQPTARSREAQMHSAYRPRRESLDLLEVLNWDEQVRRRAFTTSSMKRAKLNMMKRNALIAAGNYLAMHDDAALSQRIHQIAGDAHEDALVRDTATLIAQRHNQRNAPASHMHKGGV